MGNSAEDVLCLAGADNGIEHHAMDKRLSVNFKTNRLREFSLIMPAHMRSPGGPIVPPEEKQQQ